MTEPIRTVGLNKTPLYGSREATFCIDDTRANNYNFANSLWNGLEDSYKDSGWNLYETFNRWFSDGDICDSDGLLNEYRENIGSRAGLWTRFYLGKDSFLLSQILDTTNTVLGGTSDAFYKGIFPYPSCIAKAGKVEDKIIFTVNPIEEGIPFDTGFLYRVGEKFGKLIESS